MYTIILKEPVRINGDMKSIFEFTNVSVNSAFAVGFVEAFNSDKPSFFPKDNILGIVYEDKKEPSY